MKDYFAAGHRQLYGSQPSALWAAWRRAAIAAPHDDEPSGEPPVLCDRWFKAAAAIAIGLALGMLWVAGDEPAAAPTTVALAP